MMPKKLREELFGNSMFWGFVGIGMVVAMMAFALLMTYYGHMDHN